MKLFQQSFKRPAYKSKSILLGDSITWQYEVNPVEAFTGEWQIDAYGVAGITIVGMTSALPDLSAYDQVFILLGVNDLQVGATPAQVFVNMKNLLDAVKYRDTHIISILPLDNAQHANPDNSVVQETNSYLRQLGNYINCYDALATGPGGSNPHTYDGLHPVQSGYDIIEPIIYSNIIDL